MAKEVFSCSDCGGHGTIVYKEDDTRFKHEVLFCTFCGASLDNEIVEEEYDEDE